MLQERVEVRREQAQDILSHYRAYRERVAALREQSVGAARRMHRQAVTQGGCEAQMPQAAASMAQVWGGALPFTPWSDSACQHHSRAHACPADGETCCLPIMFVAELPVYL